MLILLLLFASIRTLQGAPLSGPADAPGGSSPVDLGQIENHIGQRTVNDIIVSCFATIFACTWSAIHPNIPGLSDTRWTRFKRQATILLCALLAPELITLWAMRQRLGAREIVERYNKKISQDNTNSSRRIPRWTLTHGFFLQMGGFMLVDSDARPVHILFDGTHWNIPVMHRLIFNIEIGRIDPPNTTEEDIQDRSKGDIVSKTIIVLQTTWFIVQCITRWSQRLPVTELEVVTLGFAMLNGITYALWWNKPQNVERPVLVEGKEKKVWIDNYRRHNVKPYFGAVPMIRAGEGEDDAELIPLDTNPGKESWLQKMFRKRTNEEKRPWMLAVIIPWQLFLGFLRPLYKLMYDQRPPEDHRVPMFYTAHTQRADQTSLITVPAIGVLFGTVHLIPSWFITFSSPYQMLLWRISALIITVEPLLMGISAFLFRVELEFLAKVFGLTVAIGIPFYPVARITLIILALTSLTSLSSAALQTIEWTTFIPHL